MDHYVCVCVCVDVELSDCAHLMWLFFLNIFFPYILKIWHTCTRLWKVWVCHGVKSIWLIPVTLLSVGSWCVWWHPESSVWWRSSLLAAQIAVFGFFVVPQSRTTQSEPAEAPAGWCGWHICGWEGHTAQEGWCRGKYNVQSVDILYSWFVW